MNSKACAKSIKIHKKRPFVTSFCHKYENFFLSLHNQKENEGTMNRLWMVVMFAFVVSGLQAQTRADDYIVKPFLPQEFLLRVHAVLRRCYKEDSPMIQLEDCTIDFSRAEVNKAGEVIPLTAKEHVLLETLARNEGRIVTVDALCEALWGDNPFGYENSLNAHVRRVREKIETNPSKPVSLITIKGLGYKLNMRK